MKISKNFISFIALLIAVVMVFSLAACNEKNDPDTQSDNETASEQDSKEPVTIKLLVYQTSTANWNDNHDSPVQKEIEKLTGITLEQQEVTTEQFSVILASGELPDIVRFDQTAHRKALIEGNNILQLDELLKTNGQDILKAIPETLEYSKLNWSEGKNKIYSIPVQVGPDKAGIGINTLIAPILRWDYYKELGYPKFSNENELLDILAEMVKNHPTTEDGKKIYGVSMWNDWGNWMYFTSMYHFTGYVNSGESCAKSVEAGSSIIDATASDGPLWKAIKFFYNANKMGILDPDALTMKYSDFEAKATAGQILYAPADWPFQTFNQNNNPDSKGYMPVPMDSGYQWHGENASLGWIDKSFAITTKSEHPERAMDLLNFLWSYDGVRTMYSGVESVHWNLVDGKPVLTEDTIEAYGRNDDNWIATNISLDRNIIGLSPYTIHPSDGQPLSLFYTEQVFSRNLNPLLKDFSDYYNVAYPAQIFDKLLEEGKNINQSGVNAFANAYPYDQSDEIKRIDGNLKDLISRYAAKCILAKSDDEFESFKEEAINEFKKAGSDKNFNSRYEWYEKAKADANNYTK